MTLIKGSCENCGFCYKGNVELVDGAFPSILCPGCKKETFNFDDAITIDKNDKFEGVEVDYIESVLEVKN